MKCNDYNKYSVLCSNCNFPSNIKCSKELKYNLNKDESIIRGCVRMDKDKFLKWLTEKTNLIIENTFDIDIENKEAKSYLKGCIVTMEEIKAQVEIGKFD